MIELLAITDDPAPADPPLRVVPVEGFGVVVGPAPVGEVDADSLWRREAQLEALMEQRTLLPIRYGTLVEDDTAAAAALAGRGEALADALRRVRGAVELSVRAVAPGEPEPGGPGEQLQARARHEGTAVRVHERLASAARAQVRHDGRELLRAAYLVDRRDVDAFVGDGPRAPARAPRAQPALHRPVAAVLVRRGVGLMADKVLAGPLDGDLDPFARPSRGLSNALSRRIDADPESVEQGLAQLVLTIVELLRQLMERQALRRIDGGGLSQEQIERLGTTFMELDRRMEELREHFGLSAEDLNLDLGPLGRLL